MSLWFPEDIYKRQHWKSYRSPGGQGLRECGEFIVLQNHLTGPAQ